MKPSAVVPRNGSCAIPRRIPTSFRGAIRFVPWPLVPAQKTVFLLWVPAVLLSARAFWHFNTAILAKMVFYHKLCRHPTNRKTKDKDKKKAKLHLPFYFEILLPGNRVELFCASALPTLGYRVWFPTPKKRKMKKEEGTPKRKGWKTVAFATPLFYHICLFLSATTFCGDGLYQI